MSLPSEDHILELMRKRDQRFMELVYDQYADRLYGVAYRIMQDDASAQDVVQESLIKVWKKAADFDPTKARLFTWMFSVVRNTAIDKVRSRQKRDSREIQIDAEDVSHLGHRDIVPEHMDVAAHLEKLEDKYKSVLSLLFFKGMTQQETSDALGIPLGTVKTRLKIGLRELRKVFGDGTLILIITLIVILLC
ncbi:MAG: RNA polymerase sigma factor [Saprospiraceae bacterium]|nr:RNA polymerase sigma factor [Saprospiraceae bacterium]